MDLFESDMFTRGKGLTHILSAPPIVLLFLSGRLPILIASAFSSEQHLGNILQRSLQSLHIFPAMWLLEHHTILHPDIAQPKSHSV